MCNESRTLANRRSSRTCGKTTLVRGFVKIGAKKVPVFDRSSLERAGALHMKRQTVLTVIAAVLSLASAMSAQTIQYPNELDGYKFVGSGKLKGLHLLTSTRDDLKRVFGPS